MRFKKKVGKKAEEDVYNSLIQNLGEGNVKWRSENDDRLGYDIKYKSEDGTWKYVEVKNYSNKKFYLSENEKEFAEENKENYEIFLVGDKIYKIDNIDFKDTARFIISTKKEYIINYEHNS